MSHSYRKTPCCGITTARSDAADKRRLNRRLRHRNKIRVSGELEPLCRNLLYNPWTMSKDGKAWFDVRVCPELMRK